MVILQLLFLRLWIGGIIVIFLTILSTVLFSKKTNKKDIAKKAILPSLIWPVAMFSPSGRKNILNHIKYFWK